MNDDLGNSSTRPSGFLEEKIQGILLVPNVMTDGVENNPKTVGESAIVGSLIKHDRTLSLPVKHEICLGNDPTVPLTTCFATEVDKRRLVLPKTESRRQKQKTNKKK